MTQILLGGRTMSANDQVIQQQILGQRNREIAPDLAESNFFELFAAEQVLKPFRAL